MAKKRRGINPNDLTTATAEADLKYGPEVQAVKGLIDQAREQYEGDVTAARGNAQAVQSYARQAKPGVADIYKDASGSANAAAADVARAFGGLGAAADIFRAATAREQGGQRSRIAEAKAAATQSLVDRGTEAKAGEAFAVNNARSGFNKSANSLSQRLADITGESQAAIVARLGALRTERAERAKDKTVTRIGAESRAAEGAANRAARAGENAADRASREKIAAANRAAAAKRAREGKGPGGVKRATTTRIENLSADFSDALGVAAANKEQPRSRVAKTMITGQTPTKTTPAVPKFDQLVASMALDMAYDGHVSRANANRLHKLGYKVSDITGATSYEDYRKHVRDNTLDRMGPK
jgi:hypothetical protein